MVESIAKTSPRNSLPRRCRYGSFQRSLVAARAVPLESSLTSLVFHVAARPWL